MITTVPKIKKLPGLIAGQFHFKDFRCKVLMKKTFFPLLSGALLLTACAKPPAKEIVDPDTFFRTTYMLSQTDSVYHGMYTKTDSAGTLLEKGNYTGGQLNGIRELYYPDGKVKVRERYKNGQMTDLYEYFHPNGKHELKGYYINGEMYGVWRKFSASGALIEEVTMSANEEMGPFSEFHENGKLLAEGYYLHGPNEDGLLKLYDEEGVLYKTMLCDSGICRTTWEKNKE